MERKGAFPLQANVNGFLHVSYTSPEQECMLLQADVGANVQKQRIQNNKSLLARSSRDHRRSGSSKG